MIQCSDDISIRHPAAPGNLTQGQTFSAQLLNLRRENRSPWPTQTFAFCTSVSQTGTYAFYDEGALKFRDRTKYIDSRVIEQFSPWPRLCFPRARGVPRASRV
jgi:hypothetical protein